MRHIVAVLGLLVLAVTSAHAQTAVVYLEGADLTGGAQHVYGSAQLGEANTNYVYAAPTGANSAMRATFRIDALPPRPLKLYLTARDDDGAGACAVRLSINGRPILAGTNPFAEDTWQTLPIPIPQGTLREGDNEIVIENTEPKGIMGMPPWFMVARCVVAPDGYVPSRDLRRNFVVTVPDKPTPIPADLPAGAKPGFALRGTKGWMWTPAQYLAEIPWLARYRMNFLMNCYGSMCDVEHYAWGDPQVNRWWEPLPAAKKRAYERVVREAKRHGVTYCFSMNPCLCTKRIVRYRSKEDLDLLWQHYDWMQRLGVKWFNISLDDISEGIDASGQAYMVNEILRRLRVRDPDVRFIFCPTYYWGDGTDSEARGYLDVIAKELDPSVYLFWTGNAVVGSITRGAAETYRKIAGHRLFLWDNYPVNDATQAMHLGPVLDRDPDLCAAVDGYMSNPHCSQNEINRVPLATCADYAYNPAAYDPARSIGAAVASQARTQEQRAVLVDLVELYAGMLVFGRPQTSFNAVRERFSRIRRERHSRPTTTAFIEHVASVRRRLAEAFPGRYRAEMKTIDADITEMKRAFGAAYGVAIQK